MLYSPIFHTGEATIGWQFYPSVVIGVLALLGIYFAAAFPLRRRFQGSQPVTTASMLAYTAGVLAIFFALVSPLDDIGDTYLFAGHMLQHLMLTLLAAPLMILGTPGWMLRPLLDHRFVRPVFRTLVSPVAAFLVFNLVYIGWHIPVFYQAALENENIHILQHLMFLSAAVINWWPVLSRMEQFPALPLPVRMVYLFLEGAPITVLSAVLAFSGGLLYPDYAEAPYRLWGLSPLADQQTGGIIMWMADEGAYLLALGITFYQWSQKESREWRVESSSG